MVPNQPAIYGKSALRDRKQKSANKREYVTQNIMLEDAQVAGDAAMVSGRGHAR